MGRLFVFMGKSASGKDTLYGELLAHYPEIHAVIPYTTRPIREGETDGGAYYFVSEDKMCRMEKENRIVESRCIRPSMDRGIISQRKMDRLTGTKVILC